MFPALPECACAWTERADSQYENRPVTNDLRRTASTNTAAAGVPRSHISYVLNHVEGGPRATKVYDRYAYDREKKVALETWSRTFKAILDRSHRDATVVPFAPTGAA